MKRITNLVTALLVAGLVATVLPVLAGNGPGAGRNGACCDHNCLEIVNTLPAEALSAEERASLVFMREEEKLARDVYLSLSVKWDVRIFARIARAEERHMAMVGLLLGKYGIADPVAEDAAGVFTNPELRKLYTELVAAGEKSLEDALWVGATIEDRDLFDLQSGLAATDNADLAMVYQNLSKGSRNHLRSFVGRLTEAGGGYTAQFLTPEQVEEILASPHERGVVYDQDGEVLATCEGGCGNGPNGNGRHGNCPYGNGGGRFGNGPNGNGNGPNGPNGDGSGDCSDPVGSGPHGPGDGTCNGTGSGG